MRRKTQGGVGGALGWIHVSIKRVTATLQVADTKTQVFIECTHIDADRDAHFKLEEDPDTKSTTEH